MTPAQDFLQTTFLITGANGMLGRAFQEILARDHPHAHVLALPKSQLDITDHAAVMALAAKPIDIILHCAALVDADYCEDHPDICRQVQVEGTDNIIALVQATGAKLFYPQSFLIFDGKTPFVDEHTLPAPLSVYGRCKLEAEEHIREHILDSLIVRMGGFFGGCAADKNFVGKFLRDIASLPKRKPQQYAVGGRIWQPTYTLDLAKNCLSLLAADKRGTYSMACEGEASFYDVAQACVNILELPIEIMLADKAAITRGDKALRPERITLSNKKLKSEEIYFQRPWREALREYLSHPYFAQLFSNP